MIKKITAYPSWLTVSSDRYSFEILPERAKAVQKIFELSIAGLGSYAIAKYLNLKSVPPFGPAPLWDSTTVDNMLRSRATVGEHQPKSFVGSPNRGVPVGSPLPNYFPKVIEEEVFQAAQEARRQNLSERRGRKGNNIANVFARLATCAYCRAEVKFHRNGSSKSLICANVLEGSDCIRSGWNYENFENSVLSFFADPSLPGRIAENKRKALVDLNEKIEHSSKTNAYDSRLELSLLLREIVSELRIASSGLNPQLSQKPAIIRRDIPERYFEIKLWDGPAMIGLPCAKDQQ